MALRLDGARRVRLVGDLGLRPTDNMPRISRLKPTPCGKPKICRGIRPPGSAFPRQAMEGFRRRRNAGKDETVLVMASRQVGQAACRSELARARVVGVVRKSEPYEGHANSGLT